ncbi:hypothetical protein L873DRAFT_232362 [Choiromyces venosus 120613-1]|uniref:Uncharacterized protein n=1 Tax=Choiromyces venosus 120613-1 TaxID=1336337 RepID=A0A3N4JYE0_9PEZI|nr:hypothetical protein L873DRAFT_232362 [Choiromyces venosus 120613-1]
MLLLLIYTVGITSGSGVYRCFGWIVHLMLTFRTYSGPTPRIVSTINFEQLVYTTIATCTKTLD